MDEMELRKELAWTLFATAALQGLIASGKMRVDTTTSTAAEFADAMFKEWLKR